MSMKSAFSALGLARKFFQSAEKVGHTPATLNALAESPELLEQMLLVQSGFAEVIIPENVVVRGRKPEAKDDMVVARHDGEDITRIFRQGQDLFLGGRPVQLVPSPFLEGVIPSDLDTNYLDATVLEYLLTHQDLIPECWPNYVFFAGTHFCTSYDGRSRIACLMRLDNKWVETWYGLGSDMLPSQHPHVRFCRL